MILNTQPSLMDYMLSISGTLILILLSGIGYFLKQFASSVKELKSTVEELRLMFSVEKETIKNTTNNIELLYDRVDLLSTRLDVIDKDVAVLKVMKKYE